MKKILLTNDDGVHSPCLEDLRKSLSRLGEVTVVVPEKEMSTVSHSLTLNHPLRVQKIRKNVYITNGTPSDCINIAVLEIFKTKPDIVVSGINMGPNIGDDVTYSGTVAASIEATLRGMTSFAISLAAFKDYKFDAALEFSYIMASEILKRGLPKRMFLNVNVPNIPLKEIKGVEITHQAKRVYKETLVKRIDPRGNAYFWLGGDAPSADFEKGSDYSAVLKNKISIMPVQLDLTDYKMINKLKSWDIRTSKKSEKK